MSTTPLKKGMTDDEIGVRVHDQLCSRTTSSSNSTVRCTFFGDKYCHKGSPQAYLASLQTIEAAANLSYTTVMIYINMNIPRLLYFYKGGVFESVLSSEFTIDTAPRWSCSHLVIFGGV